MKASRMFRVKVTRTPGRLLRRFYCVRFMEDTNGKIKKPNVAWQMGLAHEGRGAESRSACAKPQNLAGRKPWRVLGRTRLRCSFPACPRTAVLRLALCPSVSRVSVFTFVLTRLHSIAIFSVHTIHALCFSKKFFESHFLVFLTMEPSQELRLLSQMMMMGSSSSLPLFIVPHTAPPTPPKCCAGNSFQVSKTPATPRSAACKKPGGMVSLHKNIF
jgi:hypothetical protein